MPWVAEDEQNASQLFDQVVVDIAEKCRYRTGRGLQEQEVDRGTPKQSQK